MFKEKKVDTESRLAPVVEFAKKEHYSRVNSYVKSEVRAVIRTLGEDYKDFTPIEHSNRIILEDFTSVRMKYIYSKITDNIERNSSGKLSIEKKWVAVFDEESTPFRCEIEDGISADSRNRRYGYISANGSPICYLILFEMTELIDAVR